MSRILRPVRELEAEEQKRLDDEATARIQAARTAYLEAEQIVPVHIYVPSREFVPLKEGDPATAIRRRSFWKTRPGQEFTVYDQCMKNRSKRS